MQVLVDTGVLLRLLEPTDPLHATVARALTSLHAQGAEPVIFPQNAAEFWNVCTRPIEAWGGLGLTPGADGRGIVRRSGGRSVAE